MFYSVIFSEGKILFQLYNVHLNKEIIVLKKSLSREAKIEVPVRNAIRVEYVQLAQQIIGKFWFYDPITTERKFVYFWPDYGEGKWDTSKLYLTCIESTYKREQNNV